MANTLYHFFNVSGSLEAEIPTDGMNDSLVSHVIVKTGSVYYKTVFKGFHRYWCRLYRETDTYPRQLVLYEILKNKKQVSQLIPLDTVFKVLLHDDKLQFDIMTSSKKYSIRAATLEEATAWVEVIDREVFGPPLPGIIYRFRVKSDMSHKYKGPIANYLLKVYDDRIQLYSSNGKIPTNFSCDLKDIHRIKYLPMTKQKTAVNEYLSITIKSAQTKFIEKDILVLQAKSPEDLSKVINHRKELMADKLPPKSSDQTTVVEMPLTIQQQISVKESASLSAEYDNIYNKPLQPYANVQPEELHRHIAKFFSTGPKARSLPQTSRLIHTRSAPLENEASRSENQVIKSLSRLLQDISDDGQFSTSPALACASSQNNLLQVPSMATNAVMTTTSHNSLARPKSPSFMDTTIEGIYDNAYDLVSPAYHTLPSGVDLGSDYHDGDEDDNYYVVDHVDQYLEILPDTSCDEHLYERIAGDTTDNEINDNEINDDDCIYDHVRI